MIKIAVIGTSGRNVKLTSKQYNRMYEQLTNYLSEYNSKIELISGGAAWADHLAVRAYLDNIVKKLSLYLPCKWDFDKEQYSEQTNSGKMSNIYHRQFSNEVKINSFDQIQQAMLNDAYIDDTNNGYFERNDKIANICHEMIAFTISTTNFPSKGGTQYTWNKAIGKKKVHISIENFHENNDK